MQITPCAPEEIQTIFDLYDKAIEFQKTKSDKHWQTFDELLIGNEIRENRLWKIIEGKEIACIFSIAYSDPLIWGKEFDEPSLYIHRIVTNPLFRGRGYVKVIIEWAKEFSKISEKKFIRIDTWGDNQKLNDYYQSCGFSFIRTVTPQDTGKLPKHYAHISLSLFEIRINSED
ncbi:MAG: GNAT family N-acetyltransferase [Acidobacteriota bacterium]|nr:GNAT family N-acetyltransferase [Acidobacteriota bacterium]